MMARGRSAVIVLMVAYQGLPCHAAASRRSSFAVRAGETLGRASYRRSSPELWRLFLLFLHRRDASRTPCRPVPYRGAH